MVVQRPAGQASFWNSDPLDLRSSAMPDLPRQLGFTLGTVPYQCKGEFTAEPGPKIEHTNFTPLRALHQFIDVPLIRLFCLTAASKAVGSGWDIDVSETGFWKYVVAVLGHGLVVYPDEKLAYCAEKSSTHQLFCNPFLRSLHTLEGWQHAKECFSMQKEKLTDHFNQKARDLWVPTQYAFFINFYNFILAT